MGEASYLTGQTAGAVAPFINPAIKTATGLTLADRYSTPNNNMGTFKLERKGLLDE